MRLIAFDMDGTLIRNPDSVTFLCRLNHAEPTVLDAISRQEASGALSWIEADYERAKLIQGLPLQKLRDSFSDCIQLIGGLGIVMDCLRQRQYKTMLVTAGPKQVAEVLAERYSFDDCFGSDYEVVDGKFTGRIRSHMGSLGKTKCLETVCHRDGILFEDCTAVGDSSSDIDLFQSVGRSIAINCSPGIEKYACHALYTEDLTEILPILD